MLVDLREAFQKNYLVIREIVPIPSDTPTFETVSEYLDSEYCQAQLQLQPQLREAFKKKYYLDREIVPIPSDPPTIETVSEYLDSEYW